MPVTLAEELVLLALDSAEGKRRGDTTKLSYSVVGSHLLDLGFTQRITMQGKKMALLDPRPVGEPATDEVLAALAGVNRPRKPGDWMTKLASKSLSSTTRSLQGKGIVTRADRQVLGLFPVKRYPVVDERPKAAALARLHAVLVSGEYPDERTVALIGMVHASGLAGGLFPGADPKAIAARAKQIAESPPDSAHGAVAKAVRSTSAAVQVAVMSAALGGAIVAGGGGG